MTLFLGRYRVDEDVANLLKGGAVADTRTLGRGSFGCVVRATDTNTGEQVAIKLQSQDFSVLAIRSECIFIHRLRRHFGFPRLLGCGTEHGVHFMVMSLLGPNLQDLLDFCGGTFSLGTVVYIGKSVLHRLKALHSEGFIHRDVKPENFLIDDNNKIYMIDFGFAKQFWKNNRHIEEARNKRFIGTARYCPLSVHEGRQSGRRDDLEAMIYVLVYLYFGSLPWQFVQSPPTNGKDKAKIASDQRFSHVAAVKRRTTAEQLVQGKWEGAKRKPPLPSAFVSVINYISALDFKQTPDYDWMEKTLCGIIPEGRNPIPDWLLISPHTTHSHAAPAPLPRE